MELFSQFGMFFASRWLHILSGITWIGLLYYFNFVQVPSFATMDAGARTEAIDKLASRALWWFRWAAVATVVTGVLILGFQDPNGFDPDYWGTIQGSSILTGILMGIIMFLNVWGVIWRNQKVVLASAAQVLAGGQPLPEAAAAGRKALLASRTNTVLSIPMVWFMTFTSHFSGKYTNADGTLAYWLIVFAIVILIEANGLGLLAGTDPGPTKKPLETVKGAIISGFVVWVVLYLLWEVLFSF